MKRKSKEEKLKLVKEAIFAKFGNTVTIVDNTFSGLKSKCDFIDIEFGRFTQRLDHFFEGFYHKERKAKEKRERDILKIKQLLLEKYGDLIKLVEETYVNPGTGCDWIDKDFGKFSHTSTGVVYCGRVHHQRALLQKKEFCMEKYGYEHASSSPVVKAKAVETYMKNYGVSSPNKVESIKEKAKISRTKTNLERYGCEYAIGSTIVREHIKETNIERYGVENVYASPVIQEKIRQINLVRHGYEHNWAGDRKDCVNSWIEKFGVDNLSKLPEVRAKISEELKRPEIQEKIHQTMKKNGSYGKSKSEDRFYEFLVSLFSIDDVVRQQNVNGWAIDFYIKSIDTYVQFDGTYWHGLNRSIDEIKEFKKPRDKVIFDTMQRDLQQNEWFKLQDLNFIRIIDNETSFEQFLNIICQK
jgi:hypothetical protein